MGALEVKTVVLTPSKCRDPKGPKEEEDVRALVACLTAGNTALKIFAFQRFLIPDLQVGRR